STYATVTAAATTAGTISQPASTARPTGNPRSGPVRSRASLRTRIVMTVQRTWAVRAARIDATMMPAPIAMAARRCTPRSAVTTDVATATAATGSRSDLG